MQTGLNEVSSRYRQGIKETKRHRHTKNAGEQHKTVHTPLTLQFSGDIINYIDMYRTSEKHVREM